MSRKIVVLTGSARKGGNSNQMAEAFMEAAKAKGHMQTLAAVSMPWPSVPDVRWDIDGF